MVVLDDEKVVILEEVHLLPTMGLDPVMDHPLLNPTRINY